MTQKNFAILGIGNILQKDDGIALYATKYLESNYSFEPAIDIIHGGVEGINLLNTFMEYDEILILDTVDISDKAGSIYHIPTSELSSRGVNNGGAHEVGVLECLDMLKLMGEKLPQSSLLGIVPELVRMELGLSDALSDAFDAYVEATLKVLEDRGFKWKESKLVDSLDSIIQSFTNRKFELKK